MSRSAVGRQKTCRCLKCQWSMVGRLTEDLSVSQWLVVGGSVENLLVGRWSVVGGLSVVGGFIIRLSFKGHLVIHFI